jgi:hypothetical protein
MTKRALRSSRFPVLTSLVRGYLHEDFPDVHGSVLAAVAAFCADASPDERRKLVRELETLVKWSAGRPAQDMQNFLTSELGSRWEPASRDEILELLQAVRMGT